MGFDPNIILSAVRQENPNENARTLMDILSSGVQRQTQQATLADMLRKQQQQEALADVYRQNAGQFSDPIAAAAARAGLPQAPDIQGDAMQREKANADLLRLHSDIFRGQASTVKSPEQYAKFIARISPEMRARYGLGDEYDQGALQAFINSDIPAERRPAFEEQQRRQAALADPNSPTSRLRTQVAGQFGAQLDPGTPGNAVDDKELELLERGATAKDLAHLRYGPGAISGYAPEAIDAMALKILRTGEVPQFGPGATGAALRQAVFNRVAELAGGATPGQRMPASGGRTPRAVPDLATTGAQYHANADSLKEGQKVADATDVNEGKALADIEVLESTMAPIFNSNSRWLNAAGRSLQDNAGSPEVARFLTARQALISQVNKVLNAGNLTDSGRHEAEELLKKDASIAQIKGILGVLKQDMARSKDATHARVKAARDRISGKPEATEPQGAAPSAGSPTTTLQQRIGELKAQGLTKDAIKAQLQKDGLLPPGRPGA